MKINNYIKRHKAFTLIEMIVAITLIGIALTSVLHLTAFVAGNNARAKLNKQAVYLAHGLIEEMLSKDFKRVQVNCSINPPDDRVDYNICNYNGRSYDVAENVLDEQVSSLSNIIGGPINDIDAYGVSSISVHNTNIWTEQGQNTVPTTDLLELSIDISHDYDTVSTYSLTGYKLDLS